MYQDLCLACGKELDDGRAYCDDLCQSGDASEDDASSPSSSPHIPYTSGQDVPSFALGKPHDRYSTSSSSASSWSVVTDDDSEFDLDPPASSSKALFYARRPSGTNNASIFPHLHHRTSSSSSICLPQSAPSFDRLLPVDDDQYASDAASEKPAYVDQQTVTASAVPAKTRRKRNRASLPAYFSILTTSSPAAAPHSSPVSVSSTNTFSRLTPPTPKLSLMVGITPSHAHTAPPTAVNTHFTPRGRRNDTSPHRLRSSSRSASPSPGRRRDLQDRVADWSSGLTRERGRATRRNGSFDSAGASPSGSRSRAPTRGRARVGELDGFTSPERPGFGHGRSGLIARAKRGAIEDWAGVVVPL